MGRKSRKRSHKQFAQDEETYDQSYQYYDGDETWNGVDSSYAQYDGEDGEEESYLPLKDTRPEGAPEGVHHYVSEEQVPEDIQNYFRQRYRIFKLYNHGIWMTDTAWYGVTQEAVGNKIASHIKAATKDTNREVVLDIMGGAGGNTIAFARSGFFSRVYSFEKDPATLACMKHNAELYGVQNQISFFEGDCFEVLAGNEALQVLAKQFSVIFCSPPWGGPTYRGDKVFNLDTMEPYSLRKIYTELKKYTDHIVLYLPRTSDLRQIAELVEDGKKVNVIHYCTEGSSRALCVYLGPFEFDGL